MKKFSISKSDVKLAFSEKSIFHQNLCSQCLNMTPLTILDPSRGPWTGSWLATGDRNSKFPDIFVVSLYLRDLLVFDVISLVNIYNSEKRNFEKKGKISVDFSSVWWMKKFFSSLTPPRHVIPPAELEMPRCESSRSRYRYTTPAPHREMTQYQPPINLLKIGKFNQKNFDRRIDDVYLGQRFTAIYHGKNFEPHFELELTGKWPLMTVASKVSRLKSPKIALIRIGNDFRCIFIKYLFSRDFSIWTETNPK